MAADLPPAHSQLWPGQLSTINHLQPEGWLSIFQTKWLHLCCFWRGASPQFQVQAPALPQNHPWASSWPQSPPQHPKHQRYKKTHAAQPNTSHPQKKHLSSQTYPLPHSFWPEPILQTALPERRVSPGVRNYHWSHVLNDRACNALSLGLHANEENK